jgi:hypothetical protein
MLLLASLLWVAPDMRYIQNGQLRLGVDLAKGGAITYLSKVGGPNMVNDFDLGRQIQMSYYSGPVPFTPGGKQPQRAWVGLGWNPIQSGDCFGHPAKTIEFKSGATWLHLKSIPMQWPLDNEPGECVFESWIELDGNKVKVRNEIENHRSDHTQYPARTQELPAIYTNAPWYKLVTYAGERPFTNEPTQVIPQHPWDERGPWSSWQATESWAALLNDANEGIGVFAPAIQSFSGGFAGKPGIGGSSDSPTGYIAPNSNEILDWNSSFQSRYVLIVGNLDQIRNYAVSRQTESLALDFRFRGDRNHWTYVNCEDEGWPIKGVLKVKLERPDPQLIGPVGFWPASQNGKLHIRAAFKMHDPHLQVFWSRLQEPGFSQERVIDFTVNPDGKMRDYTIDLFISPEYRGVINQIRIDPEPEGSPGDEAKIERIW